MTKVIKEPSGALYGFGPYMGISTNDRNLHKHLMNGESYSTYDESIEDLQSTYMYIHMYYEKYGYTYHMAQTYKDVCGIKVRTEEILVG